MVEEEKKGISMVELLCIDVDGTLLDSSKELPLDHVNAVRYAMEKGVIVAIASGRSIAGVEPLLERLGIGRSSVCLNGGLVLYDGIIQKTSMEEELVMKIIDQAQRFGSQIFLSTAECNFTNGQVSASIKKLAKKGSLGSDYFYCRDYDELRVQAHLHKNEIIKAAIKEADNKNYELLRQALTRLGLFHVAKSDDYFVDINPKSCNKGKGVQVLADYLSIPMDHVMCIGDNENDLEMVEMAGIGVVMGNGVDMVKRKAVYITGDHDHGGVAEAIYRFIQ